MLVCFGRITCRGIYLGYSHEIKMRHAFFSRKKKNKESHNAGKLIFYVQTMSSYSLMFLFCFNCYGFIWMLKLYFLLISYS